MYNYDARLYDPAVGMFLTADTIVPDWTDPQTMNRYSYCRNNPVMFVDPSGHDFGLTFAFITFSSIVAGAQSDWNPQVMITAAFTASVSAGSFYLAGNAVAQGANAVVAHSVAGAYSGAIGSMASGGDVGMGALTGGISGAFGNIGGQIMEARGLNSFGQQLIGQSLIGGVSSGITAEIYGENFSGGFCSGALMAAAGYLFSA